MFAAQLLVAIIGTTSTISNHAAQKACVAFVCIYIAGFASTWGPMTWIYTGETFSLNIRSRSLAISTASQWVSIATLLLLATLELELTLTILYLHDPFSLFSCGILGLDTARLTSSMKVKARLDLVPRSSSSGGE